MKVRIEIDGSLNEDEIVIRTKEYTEELQQLISNFKSKPSIQFFKQDTEYYLDLDAILFYSLKVMMEQSMRIQPMICFLQHRNCMN